MDESFQSMPLVGSSEVIPTVTATATQKPDQKDDQHRSSGRDRLKRHREEVAGRVSVPERWGMEDLMSDWIDYSSFDKLLAPAGIRSAREALVVEAHRRRQATAASPRLTRIESRC